MCTSSGSLIKIASQEAVEKRRLRTFCIMGQRVIVRGKLNLNEGGEGKPSLNRAMSREQ